MQITRPELSAEFVPGQIQWIERHNKMGYRHPQLNSKGYVGVEAVVSALQGSKDIPPSDISSTVEILHSIWQEIESILTQGGCISRTGIIRKIGKMTLPPTLSRHLHDRLIYRSTVSELRQGYATRNLVPFTSTVEIPILIAGGTINHLIITHGDTPHTRTFPVPSIGKPGQAERELEYVADAFHFRARELVNNAKIPLYVNRNAAIDQCMMDLALTRGRGVVV